MTLTHGMAGSDWRSPRRHALYARWVSIRQRCSNPNRARYADYGGRGITCCERWQDFALFVADLTALPHALEPGYSIDRIDNDKGYESGNVRWSTAAQQRRNQRQLSPRQRAFVEAEESYYRQQEELAELEALAQYERDCIELSLQTAGV